MKYPAFATIVVALASANPGQAGAQTISSFYTSTAPKACRMIGKPNEEDGSTTRVCPGKSGLVVLINEGDLREVVSVGRNRAAAAREPAAQAWFGPFSSSGDTVEWRAADSKPFAIIQRWQIADNSEQDKRGGPVSRAMLAVTRLPPGEVCHVAYVDVAANPNANELARQAADDFARDFKCGADQVKTIGQSGRTTSPTKR
ncbi:hypothetical protein [Bradyrhizobium embrapense]|uniref:hypothetical protein n=1 Tax=Bradyrhizobium embrapense TaxID=630921 RepID=UPI00067DC084|nr:hypothetical protein [Bradyrhizobium embrapense]